MKRLFQSAFASHVGRLLRVLVKVVAALFIGIYFLINRTFLFILSAYLCLYFWVGSSSFTTMLENALGQEIPGFMTFGNLQWGPDPTEVRAAHVRILSERHSEVVHAPAALFRLDLLGTIGGIAQMFVDGSAPITIEVDRAVVTDPWVWVEVREDGSVGIHRAFDDDGPPRDPSLPPPRNLDIHIDAVVLRNANGWVETPHFDVDFSDLDLAGDFHVTEYPGTVAFDVPRGLIGRAELQFKTHLVPGPRLERLRVPIRDMEVSLMQWRATAFTVGRVAGALEDGSLRYRGSVETDPDKGVLLTGRTELELGSESPALDALLRDVLPIAGSTRLDVTGATDLRSWARADVQLMSPRLTVGGVELVDLSAAFDITPKRATEGHYDHAFSVKTLDTGIFGGRATLTNSRYASEDSKQTLIGAVGRVHELDLTLRLDAVDPWALLSASKAPQSLLTDLPFIEGKLHGPLRLLGRVDGGTGYRRLEARTDTLRMTWQGGLLGIPLMASYAVNGRLVYELKPPFSSLSGGLEPHEVIRFEGFGLSSGNDRITVDGDINLEAQTLDLESDVRIGNMARFIGSFGGRGVAGRLRLDDARISGAFDNPTIKGSLRVSKAVLGDRPVGGVSANVLLADGLLDLSDIRSTTPYGGVSAAGQLRLWRSTVASVDPRLPFTLSSLRLERVNLGKLLPKSGVGGVFDVALKAPLRGSAKAPLTSLTGEIAVSGRNMTLAGERTRRIQGRLVARKDGFQLRDGQLSLCRTLPRTTSRTSRCGKGGPNIRLTGKLDKNLQAPGGPRFKAHVKARAIPLRAFNLFSTVDGLRGEATTDVQVEGRFTAPRFFGSVGLRDFGVGNVELGDAQLDLTWGRAGEIVVTAMQFFDHMQLEESLVDTTGGRFKARFDATIDKLAVFSKLLPGLELDPAIDITGSGRARFELDPSGRIPWRLRFDADPGGVSVAVNDGKTIYTNVDPVRYRMVPDLLRVLQPVRLRSSSQRRDMWVCGGIRDGRWDAEVSGRIGAELLTPVPRIRDLFSALEGSLVVAPDAAVSTRRDRPRCLADQDPGVMLVRGLISTPVFDGTVQSDNVMFRPRDFGRQVNIANSSALVLRPTRRVGRQLVRVEPGDAALRGDMDDGKFTIHGDLYLQDLDIDDANLSVSGSEIYWASTGEYNLTLNPDVDVSVRDFGDDETRSIQLEGDVLVTEGNYFKSFDSFARAFGAVTGGSSSTYERPLTERVPWLKSLRMDLDVISTNFVIRSAFPTGKLDLEARLDINLSGSLDEVRVSRRVDVLPEGTISYNLFRRDFEIRSGYLEFDEEDERPRIELRAEAEVEYLERASGSGDRPDEEKQVTVIVLISGRLPDDLNIELSSQPGGFSQADLERLIVTGKPLRDTTSAFEDNLFSFDLGGFVNRLLKAPFVDAVKLGLTQEGFVDTQIVTKFGRDVSLRTRAVQEAGDSTRLSARFEFRLSDNLVLEGRAVRSTGGDFTNSDERYEARIKYRIPLD